MYCNLNLKNHPEYDVVLYDGIIRHDVFYAFEPDARKINNKIKPFVVVMLF